MSTDSPRERTPMPEQRSDRRSPVLGLIALCLALLLVFWLHIGASLFFLAFPNITVPDPTGLGFVVSSHGVGMIVAFVLGLIATVTRRGRLFGMAAMVVAVLDNAFLLVALLTRFAIPGK